jgi:hypothetical protein
VGVEGKIQEGFRGIGPDHGFILAWFGLRFGLGHAGWPVTIRKPCRTVSKRTCMPNPNFRDGSEPKELSESPELSDQVLRTAKTVTEDLLEVSLMIGVAPVNLEETSNGSGPLRFDGVDGATSSAVFIQTTPELKTQSILPQ